MQRGDEQQGGLGQAVGRLLDGLSRLLTDHLALAKAELKEDATVLGSQAAKVAVFLPAVLLGYALLCVAGAVALAPWLGAAGGFALVGGVNLVGGGLGAYLAVSGLRRREVLEGTRREVARTQRALEEATRRPVPGGDGVEKRLGA